MSSLTLRMLGYLALALSASAVVDGAEAGLVGSALSSLGHSSPVQTVQFGGNNCYYAEGWNDRGWYRCGDQWNYGFGWIGPFNLNAFGASAIRRHHRHGAVVSNPGALNPVYPRLEPPRRLGASPAEPYAGRAPAFGAIGRPGLHRFGAGGVRASPNFGARPATVPPGFAGGGIPQPPWRWSFSSVSQRRSSPHRRASLSGFCGRRRFPCRRRLAWAGRRRRLSRRRGRSSAHRRGGCSAHRRASLARFCWRRLPWVGRRRRFSRRRGKCSAHRRACGGCSAHRRAYLARFCWRRLPWGWRRRRFSRRRGRSSPHRRARRAGLYWERRRASLTRGDRCAPGPARFRPDRAAQTR